MSVDDGAQRKWRITAMGMASYTEDAVTYAKLDMSLIRNIHQNPATCTLVTGRIDFCHANGLKEPFLNHLIK